MKGLKQLFAEDGVVFVPGLLNEAAQGEALEAYSWSLDHPGPGHTAEFPGDPGSRQDLANPAAREAYRPMLSRSPLPRFIAELWDDGPVWFMYEQVFLKQRMSQRTPWHQDTPYMPIDGRHIAVAWISFDTVPREEALEFCLGSHLGPVYNGTSFKPDDPTDPLYKDSDMPRLPDIEAARERWKIKGWATKPGDVVIFHPSVLHGGGAPGGERQRRTLSLRFFGNDATYVRRPGATPAPRVEGLDQLETGQPFRHAAFQQLV